MFKIYFSPKLNNFLHYETHLELLYEHNSVQQISTNFNKVSIIVIYFTYILNALNSDRE